MSIITDTTVDFNRPDTLLIDRENKTALVIEIAVHSTHNISNIETKENMKTWPCKSKISGSLTTYLYIP